MFRSPREVRRVDVACGDRRGASGGRAAAYKAVGLRLQRRVRQREDADGRRPIQWATGPMSHTSTDCPSPGEYPALLGEGCVGCPAGVRGPRHSFAWITSTPLTVKCLQAVRSMPTTRTTTSIRCRRGSGPVRTNWAASASYRHRSVGSPSHRTREGLSARVARQASPSRIPPVTRSPR